MGKSGSVVRIRGLTTDFPCRFGAVMEAWEVRDAMENVIAFRNDAMAF